MNIRLSCFPPSPITRGKAFPRGANAHWNKATNVSMFRVLHWPEN